MTTGDKALSPHKIGVEMRLLHEAKTLVGLNPAGRILTPPNPPQKIPQPAQQDDTETHLSLFAEKKPFLRM